MHRVIEPNTADADGLLEHAHDATAPEGVLFFHANEGQPLATPWQVASLRAMMLREQPLEEGWILDPACGSGIQLAAYATVLQRPVLGVELDPDRARASGVNLRTMAHHHGEKQADWMVNSTMVAGDGTDPSAVLAAVGDRAKQRVALLHLDPARPRNSREHSLDEMQPPLPNVLKAWAPYLNDVSGRGPALVLDLSPRLSELQRLEVEGIVTDIWPDLAMTWEWTSRGRGRVDRLALWLGGASDPKALRRFVRVPQQLGAQPTVLRSLANFEALKVRVHPPQRGEFVTVVDAALVESGLAAAWLSMVSKENEHRWGEIEGRRPQVHHQHPLRVPPNEEHLVQASGRVVELVTFNLDESTVDEVVAMALEHKLASVKLRVELDPALHPRLQGSLDRQLSRRHGSRDGFLVHHPSRDVMLLCVQQLDEG